jgi:RNA polymerase sigma-70 factor (ECF subfamily)
LECNGRRGSFPGTLGGFRADDSADDSWIRGPGEHALGGRVQKREDRDRQAPARLAAFDQYRALLFSIAYRMLANVADAEDLLQETFIRWQQARDEEILSPRAFLVTILSRLCINHLQSARVQREEYVGPWLPEPIVTGPASDPLEIVRIDESLSVAFLVMLERLTPTERAVFLLREVFDYEYAEIGLVLDQSETNCRQIFSRAKHHVSAMRPRFQASEGERRELLDRFLQATASGNLEGLVSLLSDDVVLHSDGGGKAVAAPNLIRGANKVARGALGTLQRLTPKNLVTRLAQVNGDPGIVSYLNGNPYSVLTFEAGEGRITAIYVVTNPDKLAGVPRLPETPG